MTETKHVFVTGGTRGIGAAAAIALKEQGHRVVSNYVGNTQKAEAFSEEHGIPVVRFDVGDSQEVTSGLNAAKEALGGDIDILVHNAGITRDGMLHKMSDADWHDVITVNLSSCFYLTRGVLPAMRTHGFGRIVLLSSVNAQKGQLGQTNYCASKGGIIGFARALALETASKGITVNVVAPGYIDTDMVSAIPEPILEKIVATVPARRLGQAAEIAGAIRYLVSAEAAFVTGTVLAVNGGLHMSG